MFLTLHFHIPKPMWLLPTWQNVNGFIVLRVLSHPLHEKADWGCSWQAAQGTGGQGRVPAFRQVPCMPRKYSEERLWLPGGLFLLGRCALPGSIKIRVWGKYFKPLTYFGKAYFWRLKWVTPLLFVQKPCLTSWQVLLSGGKCCHKSALMMIKWFFPSLIP